MAARTTHPKARRGRGEGSVYWREREGRWCGSVSLGSVVVDGVERRVRREVFGATKIEVQRKLAKLREEWSGDAPSTLTLAEHFDNWLATAKTRVRPTTHAYYSQIVRTHIVPAIGYLPLAKLNAATVQNYYLRLEARGASARIRQAVHARLFSALKAALRLGLVPRNVAEAVDPPRYTAPTVQPLTLSQVQTLLATASDNPRLYAMVLLAVTTGLRQGELFALRRSDLDLNARTIAVRGTMRDDGTVSEPKTARARRRVDLSESIVAALSDYLTTAPVSEFVFTSPQGATLRKSLFIRREWAPLLKRAGLPPTKWHTLRHTSATLLLSQGVHPKVVQERLGHASIEMTLDIYSAVIPGMGRDAADGLDRLLRLRQGRQIEHQA